MKDSAAKSKTKINRGVPSSLKQTAQKYLADKSEQERTRLLGRQAKTAFGRKRSGKLLGAFNAWQKWELELLGKYPDEETAGRIGRSIKAVTSRRRKLRIPMFNSGVQRWQKWEKELLGKISDRDFSSQTGRNLKAVRNMRCFLGIEHCGGPMTRLWKKRELRLLGKYPDREVARLIGRSHQSVRAARYAHGIKSFYGVARRWNRREDKLLERFNSAEVARRTARSLEAIRKRRQFLGLPPPPSFKTWSNTDLALLGTMPDSELAKRLNRTDCAVRYRRLKEGILPCNDPRYRRPRPPHPKAWSAADEALLGTMTDSELGRRIHRTTEAVKSRRKKKGVLSFIRQRR